MSPALVIVAALCASWSYSLAAEKAAIREPGKIPSRILLTVPGDASRTQAVTWRTETAAGDPQAQIAPLSAEPDLQAAASTTKASASPVPLAGGRQTWHYRAEFNGLKPGSHYAYRVGDGATWSEWLTFRTAAARREPFRFIYVGDAQNDIHSHWSRTIRLAYATAPDARLIVHAGDLMAEGYDDRLWGEWCEALSFLGGMIPSLPVPGNHDLHRAPDSTDSGNPLHASSLWRQHFTLPRNGPEVLLGQSYFIDYQGVRFVSLDVNVFAGKQKSDSAKLAAQQQVEWLEKTLRDNPNRWTVVFQHQPVYPIARNRRAVEMEALLVPIFDRYHVDVVLQGHDHAYARSHRLLAGKPAPAGQHGTVYVVSVSGPKMYELTPSNPDLMAKTLWGKQLFQIVSVDGGRLAYRAYTLDGAVADSFELDKPSGSN